MSAICPECTGHSGQHALGCDRAKPRDRVEEQTPMDELVELRKRLAIVTLAVPLEDELNARIDEMCKHLATGQGFTLNGIARLLLDCQRRMAADWDSIGHARRLRIKAETASRDHPTPEEQLQAAFRAGFEWASNGTDKHGEYNGGSIEDGFEQWARAPRPATPEEQD